MAIMEPIVDVVDHGQVVTNNSLIKVYFHARVFYNILFLGRRLVHG